MPKINPDQTTVYTLVGEAFVQGIFSGQAATDETPTWFKPEVWRVGEIVGYLGDGTYVAEFWQFDDGLRGLVTDQNLIINMIREAHDPVIAYDLPARQRELVTIELLTTGGWYRLYDTVDDAIAAVPALYQELDLWAERERDFKTAQRANSQQRLLNLTEQVEAAKKTGELTAVAGELQRDYMATPPRATIEELTTVTP